MNTNRNPVGLTYEIENRNSIEIKKPVGLVSLQFTNDQQGSHLTLIFGERRWGNRSCPTRTDQMSQDSLALGQQVQDRTTHVSEPDEYENGQTDDLVPNEPEDHMAE